MSDPTITNTLNVPPDALRISASYHAGDAPAAGQPETVEITLNEGVPTDPAHLSAFVTSLVDALFRPEVGRPELNVHLTGEPLDPDRIRHGLSLINAEQVR